MRRRAAELAEQNRRDLDEHVDRLVFDLDAERETLQRRIEEINAIMFDVITTWAR